MLWSKLRTFFFPEEQVDRKIRAELEGRVLHMYYPLAMGGEVHRQLTFPDAELAIEGYQRFLSDTADQQPGHAQRKHLNSVRLNNELIANSSLNWTPSDPSGCGPASLS